MHTSEIGRSTSAVFLEQLTWLPDAGLLGAGQAVRQLYLTYLLTLSVVESGKNAAGTVHAGE